VRLAEACIANDDNFNDVIFTHECSVQLHDNTIVVYRLKDSVAPLIIMIFKIYSSKNVMIIKSKIKLLRHNFCNDNRFC
jgi:hypothetical protein